ncbi:MAG: hypothetical protein UY26_C0003G0304 [Candidatus Jorgensenbacteria bacterium GW2011_GWA1_48_13]|uniref:Uncharacterized protein n=2 Tax=Candidatus Joergenseniibacteriota TaxID=1752739 RepID=A0A0G1W7X4_9BACT|nr:MAG: hypothetical protein UY26_C0003G0304 [Candidatus Jorgensenbacteria bacterium GW2011_GWA1_48_13]KKU99237.1 MAG: hypothetical protein UY32_C0003G0007 [Candidatus Jorgensenbacteria bacterium GW2011_GWC1_48_8]KKW14808.1 MAG: hypothetical protein UY55_C0003G0024 [Candidatus Jorgensenbacteria bacterium GW2011_GWB1_50_10]
MQKPILIIAVAAVLGLAGGFALGFGIADIRYQGTLDRARSFFPLVPEMRSVSGSIKKVQGSVLTIETPPSANPFEELPTVREIVVGDATKIVKNEPKDPEEFQKEMEAYNKAFAEAQRKAAATGSAPGALLPPAVATLPPLPTSFTEKEIGLADLKTGDQISAEADKNIKTDKRFEATRIVVQGTTAPGGPATITPATLTSPPTPPTTP